MTAMNGFTKRMLLLLLLIGVSSCGTRYPLGIPEDQWVLMTSQQQLDARNQQAALQQAAHDLRVAEARAREAEALKQAADLAHRLQSAQYGERVQCILDPVELAVLGRWKTARPVALDLVLGYADKIEAFDYHGRYVQTFYAAFDGQVVRICPTANSIQRHSMVECTDFIATQHQYERGTLRQIDHDGFIRGDLYCDFSPQTSRSQRLMLR